MNRRLNGIDRGFSIGELSRRSGVAAPNIRHYEGIGILPEAPRGSGGQRVYGGDDLRRLMFVRNCRELGFPLDQVRALVRLSKSENRRCNEARDLAARQLDMVRHKIVELKVLETDLERQVAECDSTCLNGPAVDCCLFKNQAPGSSGCRPVPLVFPPVAGGGDRVNGACSKGEFQDASLTMGALGAYALLLLAACLETGGDALIRLGIHAHQSVARVGLFLAGAAVLFAYGFAVNAPAWDFGRLLGAYVSLFFVVAQVVNSAVFGVSPNLPVLVGGALIVVGGLIVTFWQT
jgi:MerR family transcriptional regulator, copper efflux regulator